MKDNPTTPIEAPFVSWNPSKSCVGFTNGRHRFSILRDMGYPSVAVTINRDDLKYFKPLMVKASKTAAQVQYNWAEYGGKIYADKTDELHTSWFERIGLPSWGVAFDAIARGIAKIDPRNKIVTLSTFYPEWAPNSIWKFFHQKYPDYGVTEEEYDDTLDLRFSKPVWAKITPVDRTLYHGTNDEQEFDTLKPTGGDPVVWLGELDTARDIYSRTIKGGRNRVFEVKLKPDAKIADLLDESQPITQEVQSYFLRVVGHRIFDHEWPDVMNYVAFHNHDHVLISMLKEAGFDGAIVMDRGRPPGGLPQPSFCCFVQHGRS